MQRLHIGSECQVRWHAAVEGKRKAAEEALLGKSDYRAQIANVRSIPVGERRAFRQSLEGQYHADDIEGARRQMADMSDDDPKPVPTGFRLKPRRPYGVRKVIIEDVASWATAQFGHRVSNRMVASCWDFFRRVTKD